MVNTTRRLPIGAQIAAGGPGVCGEHVAWRRYWLVLISIEFLVTEFCTMETQWISRTSPVTIFVFVHGINSSSDSCWLNKKTRTYWPSMVAEESRLGHPSVFVSGYPAGPAAGKFDVYDAAQHVMLGLRDAGNPNPPLDRSKIVFVCHSQGGIVVRQLLLSEKDVFKDKQVGVILCGSPSWGSIWANLAAPIAWALRYQQLSALAWGGTGLVRLDRDFRRFIAEQKGFQLTGVSLVETRGIIPFFPTIVSEASATRYWPEWYRIYDASHSSIVKPSNLSDESHRRLVDWAIKHQLAAPSPLKATTGVSPPSPVKSTRTRATDEDFREQISRQFVGRVRYRQEISELIQRLRAGRSGVYWVHGMGGMGKSFFLRRAMLDIPDGIENHLIDWDDRTNRHRAPLTDQPRTVVDVLDAIAHAFVSAFSADGFEAYHAASTAVRTQEARRAKLERRFDVTVERLISLMLAQPSDAYPVMPAQQSDHLRTEDELLRDQECELLLSLLNEQPLVRKVLVQLRSIRRSQEEHFDLTAWDGTLSRWIRGLDFSEPPAVSDPSNYLIDHLVAAVVPTLERKEIVLFLDTLEVLSWRLDWNLLRLFDQLFNHGARLLVVVASRFEPDHRSPHRAFSGWTETLRDRLKPEQFASNVRFTRSDVWEMLEKLPTAAQMTPQMADQIIAATLGVPMAVALILAMLDDPADLPSLLTDLGTPEPLLSKSQLAQHIIGRVAARFLLHLERRQGDDVALRDVIFLTLTDGGYVEQLQELWWGGKQERRNRLIELGQQIEFIDGGSVQPEPAMFFREAWRQQPHTLLASVLERSTDLLLRKKDEALKSVVSLYAWLTTYASLLVWRDPDGAFEARLQAAILHLADPSVRRIRFGDEGRGSLLEWHRSEDQSRLPLNAVAELEQAPSAYWLGSSPNGLSLLRHANVEKWPPAIQACWSLVIGIEAAAADDLNQGADLGSAKKEIRREEQRSALANLENALSYFMEDVPNREQVISTYLRLAASYSINQDQQDVAQRAIENLRRFGGLENSRAGAAWLDYGKLLHNLRMYSESNAAYERAIELDPDLVEGKLFIAHNLYHEGKWQEQLRLLEEVVQLHPDFDWAWNTLIDAIQHMPVDKEKRRSILRKAVLANSRNLDALLKYGYFLLTQLPNRERSARVILARVHNQSFLLAQEQRNECTFWLIAIEAQFGNADRARELQAELMGSVTLADDLNHLAWDSFLYSANLDLGLRLIDRALSMEPNSHFFLNTRLALLCRMQRHDELVGALARWIDTVPPGHLRQSWGQHRETFTMLAKSSARSALVNVLRTSSDSDYGLLANLIEHGSAIPEVLS
ncbi:alpha/beta fold hydrolase [Bradyrhizobium commune]|uniref:AB hydrolase-1 domain-containing protein n=1 Tax=Bradyrhizobium commune TaxID=83627 RepID=A0A7S9D758_9BRAD|nr:alpha/beta fold hydrolase [Bradyrhizobium commune]QPF92411.1 hypothetical protein IC761_03705 [Bradyrhizobium commune]